MAINSNRGDLFIVFSSWKIAIIGPVEIAKIISHYRVLDKLGRGGMGIVCKAEDLRLEWHVALKFLPEERLARRVGFFD
jgi:serine/threonine protein kinase